LWLTAVVRSAAQSAAKAAQKLGYTNVKHLAPGLMARCWWRRWKGEPKTHFKVILDQPQPLSFSRELGFFHAH
jgi:hypothetical protein